MPLFRVKSPKESHYPWDYYQRVTTVPGSDAFQALTDSKCPLVNK
jgi:branched-chain amino acid transport system substrate-binding protein